jgi:hypothetical protein
VLGSVNPPLAHWALFALASFGPPERLLMSAWPREKLVPFSTWRHVKTGGLYTVLGVARCATNAREGEESVVYVSVKHQQLSYREIGEFLDGRFEPAGG